jgi:hypothetical protein
LKKCININNNNEKYNRLFNTWFTTSNMVY